MSYEEQMYERVDENFEQREDFWARRSSYTLLGERREKQKIQDLRIKIGLKPLNV